MKKIILLLLMFNLCSCKSDTEEIIQYDKHGDIISKNYVSGGKSLDSIVNISNGKVDTKIFFKKNSETECYVKYYGKSGIVSEGNTKDKKKIGNWTYYYSNGKKIVEYKIISNEEYPNQVWTYDTNGKLDLSLSSFYKSKIEGEISTEGAKGEKLKIYYEPSLKKGTICTINLSQKINPDFSNIESVEKFTLKSDENYVFTIPLKLETFKKGTNITGYIDEHYFDEKTKNLDHTWKRTYISIPIK